jgi:divalent metal cation (Fe/Co/Zn/Cd) transporter
MFAIITKVAVVDAVVAVFVDIAILSQLTHASRESLTYF